MKIHAGDVDDRLEVSEGANGGYADEGAANFIAEATGDQDVTAI
jgi:hypothetical protein